MDSYLDLAMKRQAILERVKSGQVKDYAKVIKAVDRLVKHALADLDDDVSALGFRELNSLIKILRVGQTKIYLAGNAAYSANLATIAAVSSATEIIDLTATVDLRKTRLKPFTKKELYREVLKKPLNANGKLLEGYMRGFSETEILRVNDAIRNGHSLGLTNKELINQIAGTKANNFTDGILNISRRHAESMVRTSVQHVASAAQYETWAANRDVIKRYKFVATLDRVTSNICRTLDGQEFDFGKGPIPPVHIRCRSRTVPILNDEFKWLSKGRTRSAEDGPTTSQTSYYDWLKRQDEKAQIEVLGKKKTKLFRDGGMTNERFRKLQFDRNFDPLSLADMKRIEPEAFEKAGL